MVLNQWAIAPLTQAKDIPLSIGAGVQPLPGQTVREAKVMIVKTILKAKARGQGVVTITPDNTVREAAQVLGTHRIGALVVVTPSGGLAGILSERDIVRGVGQHGESCLDLKVSDLMTPEVRTCREDDSLESLMQTMTSRRIRHLPVVDAAGAVVGIVTIGDVVKSRLEEASMEAQSLREYVMAAR